jgi:3',5'-cyclic-AMP phosphodiesterase
MKIVHISDIHLSIKYKPWSLPAIHKLLQKIVDSNIDHLVITGDLTDNADEHDFISLRNILKSLDLLASQRTSIVIGNHDIFGGPQTAQDILTFPSKCSEIDYEKKVQKFTRYFFELFDGVFNPIEGNTFPFAKPVGNLVLIGMNTIDEYSRLRNPFASNGVVSEGQRKGLQEIFSRYRDFKKIVLSHHHFYKNRIPAKSSEIGIWNRIENYTMKLRGKKKLLNMFAENKVDLILHGHSHEMAEYFRKGIRVLNAGGTFEQENKNMMKYFLIDILPLDIDTTLNSIPLEYTLSQIDHSTELIESLAG